jgi:hypothetical protein
MKYGQIAGSKRINAFIYDCFSHLVEEDQQKFAKRFRNQPHDSNEVMHTFRELVLGAYLCSRGFEARFESVVEGFTPDWSIVGAQSEVTAIVELTTFHLDMATEQEINDQLRAKGLSCVWRDARKNNVDRLYHCLWHKAQTYRQLVMAMGIPYVVAVFLDFRASVDLEEIRSCLSGDETGLFRMYSELSGVLCFEETGGRYSFAYEPNPAAVRPMDIPVGDFPS